jgi:hypothetical protein
MVQSGIRKIRLLKPGNLVRQGRTLARRFVPDEELGRITTKRKVLSWLDEQLMKLGQSRHRNLLDLSPEARILLSSKLDPELKAEIVKIGATARVSGFWQRLAGFFGLGSGQAAKGSSAVDQALEKVLGNATQLQRENATYAVDAFRSLLRTVGGYGKQPQELDRLLLQAVTGPGPVSVPAGPRGAFVRKQISELRVSLLFGERGSALRTVEIRRGLGIKQAPDSILEAFGAAPDGKDLVNRLRKLMSGQATGEQQKLLAGIQARMERFFGLV